MQKFLESVNATFSDSGVSYLTDPTRYEQKREVAKTLHKKIFDKIKILNTKYSDIYGVTLTMKLIYHEQDPMEIHRYVEEVLGRSLCWRKLNYILYPEFTNKCGNLHYHGIVYGCYKANLMSALSVWKRKFGYVKPELKIKHYYCGEADCKNINAKYCWCHYVTKDYPQTGLWSIYNFNLETD